MQHNDVPNVEDLEALNGIAIPGDPNPSTRWRWITKGISDFEGGRIKLQVWYVANRPFTTAAAVSEFTAACTAAQERRSQRYAKRSADVTDAEMQEVGL